MNARLLSFLFLGVLAALAYHLGVGLIYERFFAASRFFQIYWYIPLVVVPASLLGLLAWSLGFYRGGGRRADFFATLILAALVVLTIPASYSCGLGCF
jgi:hypothetical protein